MSPDTRLIPPEDSQSEILHQTLMEMVDIPSEDDIKGIDSLSYIPAYFQDNPAMLQISSSSYGIHAVYLPGIYGDFNHQLPAFFRAQGRDKIIPYRASHEGLLNIIHPAWSKYQKMADMNRIDIYSKFQPSDIPSFAPYKRVTFSFVETGQIPQLSKTVLRYAHHFVEPQIIADTVSFYGFNVDGHQLSLQEEQMERIHFWRNGEAYSLCFRPEGLSYAAENAYELLSQSSPFDIQEN